MLDWLIIGGGPHGVHLALCLLETGSVRPERLCILDPHPALLAAWRHATRNVGMRHLRSTSVHHLGVHPLCLRRFARRHAGSLSDPFAAPYDRPSLELFNRHSDHLMARLELERLHHRGTARRVIPGPDHVEVATDDGRLSSLRVVLATGPTVPQARPQHRVRGEGSGDLAAGRPDLVQHVFDPDYHPDANRIHGDILVVGGGISAAQITLQLARDRPGRSLTMLSDGPLRSAQFDVDPGWLGDRRMGSFLATGQPADRLARVRSARPGGSIPPQLLERLIEFEQGGALRIRRGRARSWSVRDDRVDVRTSSGSIRCDRVVLATGMGGPGVHGRLFEDLRREPGLPAAGDGVDWRPLIDLHLRWHPRVHLTGAAAELELGPVAQNLAGARRAAQRILTAPGLD